TPQTARPIKSSLRASQCLDARQNARIDIGHDSGYRDVINEHTGRQTAQSQTLGGLNPLREVQRWDLRVVILEPQFTIVRERGGGKHRHRYGYILQILLVLLSRDDDFRELLFIGEFRRRIWVVRVLGTSGRLELRAPCRAAR